MKNFVAFFSFASLVCSPFLALAIDPSKSITQYVHEIWQTEDGLPHDSITAIVQTRDGYIWLGTGGGLVRFDGVRFAVFDKTNTKEIRNNEINALFEGSDGSLWIGTAGGGLVQNKEGRFKVFTTQDGLPHDYVMSISGDREGSLWISTEGGVSRWKNGEFTSYTIDNGLSANNVRSVFVDREGNVWMATYGGGLNRFKDGKFIKYTTKEGLTSDFLLSLHDDRQGSIWIGTVSGLNQLKDGKIKTYTVEDGLSHNAVRSIFEDGEGVLWVGTYGGGLNRFQNGKFTAFTTKEGLSHDYVMSMNEDSIGSLWIGTYGGGLNLLKDGKFTSFTAREGLSADYVMSICEDSKGNFWIGTGGGGLNRFRNGEFTLYSRKDGLSNDLVLSVFEDSKGRLWIGTGGGGLNRFRNGRFITYKTEDGLSHNFVRAISESRDGSLWIGTHGGGLNRLKDGKFTSFTTKEGLSHGLVMSICEDKEGRLWIGTGKGLNCFKEGKFSTYTTKDGLSHNFIRTIYESRDNSLWIGTHGGGLNRLKNGKFTIYTMKEGLFDDAIYQILEDEKGNLWMGCSKGIFHVSIKQLNDFAEEKIGSITSISYDKTDGMRSSECTSGTQPGGWKSRNGRLWFPTLKGVTMIDPENIRINEAPPIVTIEEVIVDQESYDLAEKIRLSPGKINFEFHYTGLSFLAPEKVKFKYMLKGFDKEWVVAGTRRTAYYTSIPPRKYRFNVIACNSDGVWNTEGASFDFYLMPYFYQTKLFSLICVVSVIASAVGIYRWRVSQLKKRKKELEKQVSTRTTELRLSNNKLENVNKELNDFAYVVSHDLKAPLRAVSQLSTWISEDYTDVLGEEGKGQISLLHSRVQRMDNLIDGVLQYSRAGRPQGKEEETSLNDVVKEIIESIAPPDNIEVKIDNKLPIVLIDRVRIGQVFQNLISNAIKYMDKPKGEVRIGCTDEGTNWKFFVADNGMGIEEEHYEKIFQIFQTLEARDSRESTGVGLSVVKKIVELYGGRIWVESEVRKGSTFFFTLPKEIEVRIDQRLRE